MKKNFIIICFFIILFLIVFFVWSKYTELKSQRIGIEQTKQQIEERQKRFQRLSNLYQELKEYDAELLKIDSAIPPGPRLPTLYHFLQTSSAQHGLILKELEAVSTIPAAEFPKLQETLVTMNISGSYSSFKRFLSFLENSARLIAIESISFSSPEEGNIFSFDISIKTYSY